MKKTRTIPVKMVGIFLTANSLGLMWKVRMSAKFFPFYFDSAMEFDTKEQADAMAKRWERRSITITIANDKP